MNQSEENYILICMPSGEVFYITDNQLYALYENELIQFDSKKEFWYFEDVDFNMVMRIIGNFVI